MDKESEVESKIGDESSRVLTSQDEVTAGCNESLHDDKLSVKMDLEPLDDEDLEYLAAAEAMEVQIGSPEDITCTTLKSSYDLLREHSYSKSSSGENEEIVYDTDPELQMVIDEEALEFSKLTFESAHLLSDSDDEGDKNYRNILRNMTTEDKTNDQLLCKCLLCQRVWNETEPFLRHLLDKHSSVPYVYVVEIDDVLKITSTSKMDKLYLNHVLLIECETAAVLYKCSICFDLLRSYKHFGDHMRDTHDEDVSKYAKIDTHSCMSCLWEYMSNEEYSTHGRDVRRNCPSCGVIFSSCSRMGDHLVKNVCVNMLYCPCGQMGEPAFHMVDHAFICPVMPDTNDTLHCPCGFFGSFEVTAKHFKTCQKYNGSNDCYICIICNTGFYDLGRLAVHWSLMHTDCGSAKVPTVLSKTRIHCVLCGVYFSHSSEYIPHMDLVHKKTASFPCMDCLTLFHTSEELYRHTVFNSPRSRICYCGEVVRKPCQLKTIHAGCLHSMIAENSLINKNSYGLRNYEICASSKKYKDVRKKYKACKFCQKPFKNSSWLEKHEDVSKLRGECAKCGTLLFRSDRPPRCATEAAKTRCKCSNKKSISSSKARDESSIMIDGSDTEYTDEDDGGTVNEMTMDSFRNAKTLLKLIGVTEMKKQCGTCGLRVLPSYLQPTSEETMTRCQCTEQNLISNSSSNALDESSTGIDDSDTGEGDRIAIDDPSYSVKRENETEGETEIASLQSEDGVSEKSQIEDYARYNRRDRRKAVTTSDVNDTSGSSNFVGINTVKTETGTRGFSNLESGNLEIFSVNANPPVIKTEIKTEPESVSVADMVLDVKIDEEAGELKTYVEIEQVGDESTAFKFQCKGCKLSARTLKGYIPHYQNHGLKMGQCMLCRKLCSNSAGNGSLLNHLLCHVATNYNVEWGHLKKHLISALKPTVYTCSFCDQVVTSDELYQHWEDHYLPKMKNMVVLKLLEPPRKTSTMIPSPHKPQISSCDRNPTPKSRSSTILQVRSPKICNLRGFWHLHPGFPPHSSTGSEAVPLSTQDKLEAINLLVVKSIKVQNCNVCNKYFARQFDLKLHLIEHLVEDAVASPKFNGVYTCQICQDQYIRVLHFRRHLRDHTNRTALITRLYQCEICDEAFADSSNFRKHKKVHNIICMQCDTCGRKFTSKKMLERHMNRKTIPSPHKPQISSCDRNPASKSRSSTTLQVGSPKICNQRGTRHLHPRRVPPHSSTGSEAVPLSTQDKLEVINLLVVKSRKVQNCNVCNKYFARQFDLKRHLVEHLVEDTVASPNFNGVFTCQICQDQYIRVLHFKRHLRDHANLTVYQCEICDKAFADSSNFCKHKKVHNIICMQCDTCGRKFTSKKMLEKHMNYHSNTQPVNCPLCERYFYFESGLKKHIAAVHSKKSRVEFICQVCLYRFDSMKKKWDHMWKAHHIRSVEADCPFCEDVGFRKKQDLYRHLKKEHPDVSHIYHSKERSRKANQAGALAMIAGDNMDDVDEIDVPFMKKSRDAPIMASDSSKDPEQLLHAYVDGKREVFTPITGVPTRVRSLQPRILKRLVKTQNTVYPPQDGASK